MAEGSGPPNADGLREQPTVVDGLTHRDRWAAVLRRLPDALATEHVKPRSLASVLLEKTSIDALVGMFALPRHESPAMYLTMLYLEQTQGRRPDRRTSGQCTAYLLAYGSLMRRYKALDPNVAEKVCAWIVARMLAEDFPPEMGEMMLEDTDL